MSLTGIKAAIVASLNTISGLTAYSQLPESINEPLPVALVIPRTGEFDMDAGGNMLHKFEVTLLLQRMGDLSQAQTDLDTYLDDTGTYSIKATLESTATVLTGHAHCLRVERWRDYGGLKYAEQDFLGCRFDISVIA